MKHFVLACISLLGSTNSCFALLNYTESNLSVAYAYNPAPVVMGELPPGIDDGMTNPYPIGFSFQFGSVLYTQFIASSNGWMTFNMGCIGSDPNNQLAGNATQTANAERPIIAPLWDDLDVDATGNVNYQLTGSAPNRVLTVEWKKMRWRLSATGPVISFQVKLYEGTNVIDMCYKQEASAVSSGSASIGLEGPSGTDYYSLTNTTAAPGVNNNAGEVTTLNAKPANNQVYRWTNNSPPLPVELISFTGEQVNGENQLQWITATEVMNDYFTVERSEDGIVFTVLERVDGHGSSSQVHYYGCTDAHPGEAITYYRLKDTDYNGRTGVVGIIAITSNGASHSVSYPNPANEALEVDCILPVQEFSIVDVTGRTLMNGELEQGHNVIDVNVLPSGIYFLLLEGETARRVEIVHP